MESLYQDLEQLSESGRFYLAPDEDGSLKMELQFQFGTKRPGVRAGVAKSVIDAPTPLPAMAGLRWDIDQINDFVYQLSFLDAKEEEEKVQNFQHLTQVGLCTLGMSKLKNTMSLQMAFRLFDLCKLLRELAHPKYATKQFQKGLKCSMQSRAVDHMVSCDRSSLLYQ